MSKLRKALPFVLLAVVAIWTFSHHSPPQIVHAQQLTTSYDCTFTFHFTAATANAPVPNANASRPCVAWRVTYTTTGFSSVTVQFETSPDTTPADFAAVPNTGCSSSAQPPCFTDGASPIAPGVQGTAAYRAYAKYVRVNVTSITGSGTGDIVVYGYKGTSASAGIGSLANPGLFVPYTGANANVNLGIHSLTAGPISGTTGGFSDTVTVGTSLLNATAPTVTPTGTPGTTTYQYSCVAKNAAGTTWPSAQGFTTTGNASLSVGNNTVTCAAVTGSTSCDVYRTVGGASFGLIGNVACGGTLNDTGLTGDNSFIPFATGVNFTARGLYTPTGQFVFLPGSTAADAPNFVLGSRCNYIDPTGNMNTILGGGQCATGYWNSIGPSASLATIAGGYDNHINCLACSSFGGMHTTVNGSNGHNNIVGGTTNTIDGTSGYSIILGGANGLIHNAGNSVVLGGDLNEASADYAFAAGRQSKARHSGSFVFADDTAADFVSNTSNSFALRFANGYRFTGGGPASFDGAFRAGATTLDSLIVTNGTYSGLTCNPLNVTEFCMAEEFPPSSTTALLVGTNGWNIRGTGGTVTYQSSVSPNYGIARLSTDTTATHVATLTLETGSAGIAGNIISSSPNTSIFIARLNQTTEEEYRFGYYSSGNSTAIPTNGAYIRFDTALKNVVSAVCNDAGNKCGLTTLGCSALDTVTFSVNGGTATGSVLCTGSNAIANLTPITVTSAGIGYNSTGGAASGTITGGTAATKTGAIALTTVLGAANSGPDVDFMACIGLASIEWCYDTGVAADANFHKLQIRQVAVSSTMGLTFYDNAGAIQMAEKTFCPGGTCNVNVGMTGGVMSPGIVLVTQTTSATAKTADFDFWGIKVTGLAR